MIELLFVSLTVEALQGKTCQDSLLSGEGRSLGTKISGGRGRPWGIFFGFYKTRHILLSDSANCTVLRAVVLTQYQRVTDRQTDGIAVASTALAMRRAVKMPFLRRHRSTIYVGAACCYQPSGMVSRSVCRFVSGSSSLI